MECNERGRNFLHERMNIKNMVFLNGKVQFFNEYTSWINNLLNYISTDKLTLKKIVILGPVVQKRIRNKHGDYNVENGLGFSFDIKFYSLKRFLRQVTYNHSFFNEIKVASKG